MELETERESERYEQTRPTRLDDRKSEFSHDLVQMYNAE